MRNLFPQQVRARLTAIGRAFDRRGLGFLMSTQRRLGLLGGLWLLLFGGVFASRLIVTAQYWAMSSRWLTSLCLYLLIALAPLAGIVMTRRAFPSGLLLAVPQIPLARLGRWRALDPLAAGRHPRFGMGGLMAGFAIGLLMAMAVRTSEFVAAVPALAAVSEGWAHSLFLSLAVDCIVFNLLYAIAFVMAVRHVPWFPRMMLLIWLMDISSQIVIARLMGNAGLPPPVAAALVPLLKGNIDKTLISIALWLPYLLLSERVNVTYRRRVADRGE